MTSLKTLHLTSQNSALNVTDSSETPLSRTISKITLQKSNGGQNCATIAPMRNASENLPAFYKRREAQCDRRLVGEDLALSRFARQVRHSRHRSD